MTVDVFHYTYHGKPGAILADGCWYPMKGQHGLISIAARSLGNHDYESWGVKWEAAGRWKAMFFSTVGVPDYRVIKKEYFNSEDEAKRYLETFSALYRGTA